MAEFIFSGGSEGDQLPNLFRLTMFVKREIAVLRRENCLAAGKKHCGAGSVPLQSCYGNAGCASADAEGFHEVS
jgi:hypothetical protein